MTDDDAAPRGRFVTTRWSAVLAAQSADRDAPEARAALSTLLETAWYPLYVFLRRRGESHEDACDLTQGFVVHLLERDDLMRVDRERGRLRSFLVRALVNYANGRREAARARKRGGGAETLSLDAATAAERFALEPEDDADPEACFESQWARTLLDATMARLEEEYERKGKRELFDALSPCLAGGGEDSYRALAERLDATEGAVKVTVHRMRARFRELLRSEVADTLADPGDVDDEIRLLFAALAPR